MSLRKIRPSSEDGASNAARVPRAERHIDPDPKRHGRLGDQDADQVNSTLKRRKVPENVTRNACTNCKKARAKCDGRDPCARCFGRGEGPSCLYEVHIKHAKEELVKQIKDLKAKDAWVEQILTALAVDDLVPRILQSLKNGDSLESIASWLDRSSNSYPSMSPSKSQQDGYENSEDHDMDGMPTSQWTMVTSDPHLLDHLFQLYFAWIHPVHTLFSEGHFVDSYKRRSNQFCSTTLVNALCAMACHLHSNTDGDERDFKRLATRFEAAALRHLDPFDRSATTIQALAVLSLVESARGRCLRADAYLKAACRGIVTVSPPEDKASALVAHTMSCGIQCLSIEWAQMMFQAPTSTAAYVGAVHDAVGDNLDEAQWYLYRSSTDDCPSWPSLLTTANREKRKLSEIIKDAVLLLYGSSNEKIQAHQVLQLYGRYVKWRENLPRSLGNVEGDQHRPLPHVLSLLILYSTSIIQLLRPLLELDDFPTQFVQEVIWNHSQQGLFLLDEHYGRQYTYAYQPVLQMFGILQFCDLVIRFFPSLPVQTRSMRMDGRRSLRVGLEALLQSGQGFPIASTLQELLKHTAVERSVPVPQHFDELASSPRGPRSSYNLDDILDACTRPTYLQPVCEILPRYSATFSSEWAAEAPAFGFKVMYVDGEKERITQSEESRGAQNLMQIRNLLNLN